jgi:hypothetical protein
MRFDESKKRNEKRAARKAAKPLTRKEVEKQIRSGKLTKEQALELRQQYMDSLEYLGAPQPDCGGIQPQILLPEDKEE